MATHYNYNRGLKDFVRNLNLFSDEMVQKCSLKFGQKNYAVSVIWTMTIEGEISRINIVRTEFNLSKTITFPEADELLQAGPSTGQRMNLHVLNLMARSLREQRIKNGYYIAFILDIYILIISCFCF